MLFHVLLAMVTVIVAGRLLGVVFRGLKQPQVIGEMIAGILLGPSFLGAVSPEVRAYLLPEEITPLLQPLAQLGVIMYMFLVGLELNTGLLRERREAMIAISRGDSALGAGRIDEAREWYAKAETEAARTESKRLKEEAVARGRKTVAGAGKTVNPSG